MLMQHRTERNSAKKCHLLQLFYIFLMALFFTRRFFYRCFHLNSFRRRNFYSYQSSSNIKTEMERKREKEKRIRMKMLLGQIWEQRQSWIFICSVPFRSGVEIKRQNRRKKCGKSIINGGRKIPQLKQEIRKGNEKRTKWSKTGEERRKRASSWNIRTFWCTLIKLLHVAAFLWI